MSTSGSSVGSNPIVRAVRRADALFETVAFAVELPPTSVGKVDKKTVLALPITPGVYAQPAQDVAALGYPYSVSLRLAERNHLACVFDAQFLRIGIDKPSPPLAMKRLPRTLGLSESIRHRV